MAKAPSSEMVLARWLAKKAVLEQHTRDRQKAPEIAPLFNAFQRAGPRPENSFLYLLGHIDLASIRASSAP